MTEEIKSDEWALFRMTDVGLKCYHRGGEFRANIMSLHLGGEPAVEEISRHQTNKEAKEAHSRLPENEQQRTLLRAVRPK